MRIINHHRNCFVNFDNMEIHIDDMWIFTVGNGNFTIVLGEYDTKERTSEVFEEIHKAYMGILEIEEEMKKIKGF